MKPTFVIYEIVTKTIIFITALCFCTLAMAHVQVTDLYEVELGNVAFTSVSQHLNNQYIYSAYGVQKNLVHPIRSDLAQGGSATYHTLDNQTRQPLSLKNNQFGYTAQSEDPSTSLMMLGGFRNYAPGVGRFIQPDTYNSFSKTSIDNGYAYVDDAPTVGIDQSGHFAWTPLNIINTVGIGVNNLVLAGGFFASLSKGPFKNTGDCDLDAFLRRYVRFGRMAMGLDLVSVLAGFSAIGYVVLGGHRQSIVNALNGVSMGFGILAAGMGMLRESSSLIQNRGERLAIEDTRVSANPTPQKFIPEEDESTPTRETLVGHKHPIAWAVFSKPWGIGTSIGFGVSGLSFAASIMLHYTHHQKLSMIFSTVANFTMAASLAASFASRVGDARLKEAITASNNRREKRFLGGGIPQPDFNQ